MNRLTHRLQRLLPQRSVRVRLTLLYGGLFLLAGGGMLAITYLLVSRQYHGSHFTHSIQPGRGPTTPPTHVSIFSRQVSDLALNTLLEQSLIALAIMSVVCLWLGWLVAGRILRPLRTMTEAVQNISATDLHQRLALTGPDDELRRLGNTFDSLLERLEASFEAQRRFVANASHELRTPLTLQRALVQVALADRNADTAALREMGKDVLAAGERQEELIDALLTLSRSQAGLDRQEPVNLAEIAANALDTFELNGLMAKTSLQPAHAIGNPALLERLTANIIGNAVRHNVPDGEIDVRTYVRSGRALLTVANTGPVIPSHELVRLFQPFQRLAGQRIGSQEGVGLGLSIVEAIARAHDARIDANPLPNGGLQLEVSFPARSTQAQEAASVSTERSTCSEHVSSSSESTGNSPPPEMPAA